MYVPTYIARLSLDVERSILITSAMSSIRQRNVAYTGNER